MDKEELTSTSGTKALTLSFEMLMTLPGLVPSSLRHGALRLLSGHYRLEANHMGHQQTDLRSISRPLFHEPLLGRVNPSNSIDQALAELHLRFLGDPQFLSQALHLRLYLG
jgi:hypothetical protein